MDVFFRPLLAAMLLLLGACNATTIVGTIDQAGVADEYAYAVGGRDMTTVVIGNPFALPKAQVDAAIAAALQHGHIGPPTRFTTLPGASALPGYRIAVMFNPPMNLDLDDLCGGHTSALRAERSNADLRVVTTFCSHGVVMSHAYARAAALASPTDPAMNGIFADLLRTMIPAGDPLLIEQ